MSAPISLRASNGQPLVVVCASGGASRSAAWTGAVLARLAEDVPGFSSRVVLITGASGGMVGAADYVAGMTAPPASPQPAGEAAPALPLRSDRPYLCVVGCENVAAHSQTPRWFAPASDAIRRLGEDHLSHVVHRMVHVDLPLSFTPITRTDRGDALERAWRENLAGRLDVTFRELREGEERGWRPSLVFSPMLVEDGRRLLISNLDLAPIAMNRMRELVGMAKPDAPRDVDPDPDPARPPPEAHVYSRSELELQKLFPDHAIDLKLSTAARMSASFPYVSPASTLPTMPRRRVVDAGYYDNYGVNLAAIWLDANRGALAAHDERVVVVQIRDGPTGATLAAAASPPDTSTPLTRGLEGLTSPVSAILAARNASMSYRNDEALEILQRSWRNLTTVVFEAPPGVSMTWFLSQDEQRRLLEHLGHPTTSARVDALREWFRACTPL